MCYMHCFHPEAKTQQHTRKLTLSKHKTEHNFSSHTSQGSPSTFQEVSFTGQSLSTLLKPNCLCKTVDQTNGEVPQMNPLNLLPPSETLS